MVVGDPGTSHELSLETSGATTDVPAKDNKFKMKAAVFLSTVAGAAAVAGFGTTLAAAKNKDSTHFAKGMLGNSAEMQETGTALALRALRWGTFYAVTGCGVFFWAVWKLSGAHSLVEFRQKVGSCLPRIPRNDSPQGRTEFENLTDLLKYLSEDGGSAKHSPDNK